MPIDDRLRDALEDEAGMLRPDVEEHLRRVRGRSASSARRLRTPMAAALVLLVSVAGLRLANVDPRALVGPLVGQDPPAVSPSPRDRIAGTYQAIVEGEDATVGARSFTGEWGLVFGADSSVSVMPPPGFDGGTAGLAMRVYAVTGEQLVTTLFASDFSRACASVGRYRWTLQGDRLRLYTADDMCRERVAVLTSAEWLRVTE